MVRWFRSLLEAVQTLVPAITTIAAALSQLCERISSERDLSERVTALELSRAMFEAEAEAERVKIEARFKAVRATEERIRHANRNADAEEEDDEADSGVAIPPGWNIADGSYAPAEQASTVRAVLPRVAPRTAASAKKWGR